MFRMNKSSPTGSRTVSKNDRALLSSIGEYQAVSIRQLAAISNRSNQVIRRRLRFLKDQDLIIKKPLCYGRKQGRPEEIILLSQQGLKLSVANDALLPAPIKSEDIKFHTIDHELLLNWFRIHLIQMERVIPSLSIKYIPTKAPSAKGQTPFRMHLPAEKTHERKKAVIPDGIFTVLNIQIGKALLFFLEVDMGSETLICSKKKTNNIHHKILCYQELYRSGHYKSLEEIFGSTFKGFRLLFLTDSEARTAALCRFAQATQNSDFIWLTDRYRMFDHGLAANIWVRGGKYQAPRESILGRNLAVESRIKACFD